MSKKTDRTSAKLPEHLANSGVVQPIRRQFKAPACPRCPVGLNENTERYAQTSHGDGTFVKYCRCKRCNWTWTVNFRKPVLDGESREQ